MINQLSAQLWSVKDETEKDFFGTLEKLARMGYTGVEFAGYANISAKDMKNKLDELQLTAISAHVGIDALKNNLDSEIEYLKHLGAKYIVCPGAKIDSVKSALEHAELFNQIGKQCKEAGLIFAYHNHEYEFKLDNGIYPLDVLFANTDEAYVKQQPDVYWVAYAGLDVNDYITKHIARCPIIHLKQMENDETKRNVDASSGIIDFEYIMKLEPHTDFVYEQEEFIGTSLENMKKSCVYIMSKF